MKYWFLSILVLAVVLGSLYYVFGEDSSQPSQYNSSSAGGTDSQYNFHIP